MPLSRESHLMRTMVELADVLVDEFDVVDLLSRLAERCVEVLGISAAGVMLAAPEGDLRVVASSSEAMYVLELFELQAKQGPCVDCYRMGELVSSSDLGAAGGPWPSFSPVALRSGFRSVHALPMRLRQSVIGALNLFGTEAEAMTDADIAAGQAMADVATIAILMHRSVIEARVLSDQLAHALNSRIIIEQAKGVLAERAGLSMEAAFESMRGFARRRNARLSDVAHAIVERELAPAHMGLTGPTHDEHSKGNPH